MAVEAVETTALGKVVGLEGGAIGTGDGRSVGIQAAEVGDEGRIDNA